MPRGPLEVGAEAGEAPDGRGAQQVDQMVVVDGEEERGKGLLKLLLPGSVGLCGRSNPPTLWQRLASPVPQLNAAAANTTSETTLSHDSSQLAWKGDREGGIKQWERNGAPTLLRQRRQRQTAVMQNIRSSRKETTRKTAQRADGPPPPSAAHNRSFPVVASDGGYESTPG